jgi:dUTP pyrophosphatase
MAMAAMSLMNGNTTKPTLGATTEIGRRDKIEGKTLVENAFAWALSAAVITLDYALLMTETVPVLIVCDDSMVPLYAKPGDAGADLRASHDAVVPAGERLLVKTGCSLALPGGYVGLVHPRSGLALKHGITVLNSPGTIDAGYRGEIMVTLFNSSKEDFSISVGDRIAQLLIQQVVKADFVRVQSLPQSDRGESGYGSSGKN